jgi:ATP-binding cassette subfamily B protein
VSKLRERVRVAKTVVVTPFQASPRLSWFALVLAVVGAVTGAILPLGSARLVNGVVDGDSSLVHSGAAILAIGTTATFVAISLSVVSTLKMLGHVGLHVRSQIAELAAKAPRTEHFERPDYLRELELLQAGAWDLANGPRNLMTVMQLAIRVAIASVLLAAVSPYLVGIVLVAVIPLLASKAAVRRQEKTAERMAEHRRLGDELFRLATTAAPARELRVYGIKGELRQRHRDVAEQVTREVTHTNAITTLISAAGWATYALAFAAAVVLVAIGAADGATTVGAVVLTMQIGRQVTGQISGITESTTQLLAVGRTTRRLLWLSDYTTNQLAEAGDRRAPDKLVDGIRFDDVSFTYPGTDRPVLENVNVHLAAGSTVAIVGANGAGKTTLVKLITGMYRPTDGRILVDGTDLDELAPPAWRERLAGGFQDFLRPELRAIQAIGLGDLPRIEDRVAVDVALDRAGATDVLGGLSDGLDTALGRSFGGSDLSIGQWQKLALARAVMRDDPLTIVFDEPTASLDATTEHGLFERFADAARTARPHGTITILISHRFSTVQMADRILVIDGGTVAEDGSHADLIRAGGTYASMYQAQAQAYR